MNGDDPHVASGAYVVHALPPRERRAFEGHLASCKACAREVAEFSATVTRLAQAVALEPPAELKRRVLERIDTTQQDPPEDPSAAGFGRRLSRLVLAACLALAVAFGGIAVWQHQEAESARSEMTALEEQAAGIADIVAAPDAKFRTQELSAWGYCTLAVSRSQDSAAFIATRMPPLPAGKTYQLWFSEDGSFRPAGLLRGTDAQHLRLLAGPVGQATAVGITVEPAGGSPQPTSPPLGMIPLPA
ncbi:anti-sigma factor domain-containing protein [Streptomyces sp. NPDC057445]|uniref:anti-sigma factor n=1 Tax=Streptomyces sp. NPDC057445 TaxID=3346136 RepID=UPI0036BD3A30